MKIGRAQDRNVRAVDGLGRPDFGAGVRQQVRGKAQQSTR